MYLVKNKKSPNYQVVYFNTGKRTTISANTSCKNEAEKFLRTFIKPVQSSQPTERIEVKNLPPAISLLEFKEEYLNYVTPLKSPKYIRSIELSFRQFYNSVGSIPLTQIDVRAIDKFITVTFGRTQRGAHLYYRTLKAAFTKAVSWDYIKENPFKKIKLPRIPKNYPVFISLEEFKIILAQTRETILKDLFTTALYTGMRQGELVNMKWDWIDENISTIKIKCTDDFNTKSKKERIIPINSILKEIFESHKLKIKNSERDIYIFTNSNGIKLNEDFVSKKFKKAVRSAGLNDEIHFHTLRHSFASMLVQKGVSLYVVKELLGHEDLSTTQIYSHLQTQNLFDAVNML
jgi:site-specific recombinase XerD